MTPDGKASLDVALPASARKMHPTIRFLKNTDYLTKKMGGIDFTYPPISQNHLYGRAKDQAPRPCVAA